MIEGASDQPRGQSHVGQIPPQSVKPAVSKDDSLKNDHRREDSETEAGSAEDDDQSRADQMAGGAARNRKMESLGGKKEGRQQGRKSIFSLSIVGTRP